MKQVWSDPGNFATTLMLLLLDNFGTEALEWEMATIEMEVRDEWGAEIPYPAFQRLMYARMLHTHDYFWWSPSFFGEACVAFNGPAPAPGTMLLPEATDLAWGVAEVGLLFDDKHADVNSYSPEIRYMVGEVLDREGIIKVPGPLKMALRDRDPTARITGSLDDDPEMFQSVWQTENDKTLDVTGHVKSRMNGLGLQLTQLPIVMQKQGLDIIKKLMKAAGSPEDHPPTNPAN